MENLNLRLHLHIQSLGQVVIFYEITGFHSRGFLKLFSIFRQLADI